MAHEDRHAHAGRGDFDRRVDDLFGFGDHLPFFLGRTVFEEDVDMRNHVEGDLLGELAGGLVIGRVVDAFGLIPKLINAFLARAGNRLVSRDDDALDLGAVVQRLQRHDHLRGRAVGVGDDVFLGIAVHVLRVHLGHDQRHVLIIAVKRGVIDHHAARFGSGRGVFLGRFGAHGKERHVPASEVESVEVFGLQGLVPKADFRAQRTAAGQSHDLVHGELTLREDVQHFTAHIACGTDDGDAITHLITPVCPIKFDAI